MADRRGGATYVGRGRGKRAAAYCRRAGRKRPPPRVAVAARTCRSLRRGDVRNRDGRLRLSLGGAVAAE